MSDDNILKLPKLIPDEEARRLLTWVDSLTLEELQYLEKLETKLDIAMQALERDIESASLGLFMENNGHSSPEFTKNGLDAIIKNGREALAELQSKGDI